MPTGLDALDQALSSGGFPRGRLTEVVGATGKLSLLRQVVNAAVDRGEWVAFIDASRTLSPRDWAHLETVEGFWVVRPPSDRAVWCADVLLRSAAFSLVVLDSAPAISRAVSVRLMGLARESNAAFVVVGDGATKLGGAVRLRVTRRRQRLRIEIEKGCRVQGAGCRTAYGVQAGVQAGVQKHFVEIRVDDSMARRLCAYPEVPDRRGAARASAGRDARRGRRAAEPFVERGKLQAR